MNATGGPTMPRLSNGQYRPDPKPLVIPDRPDSLPAYYAEPTPELLRVINSRSGVAL